MGFMDRFKTGVIIYTGDKCSKLPKAVKPEEKTLTKLKVCDAAGKAANRIKKL